MPQKRRVRLRMPNSKTTVVGANTFNRMPRQQRGFTNYYRGGYVGGVWFDEGYYPVDFWGWPVVVAVVNEQDRCETDVQLEPQHCGYDASGYDQGDSGQQYGGDQQGYQDGGYSQQSGDGGYSSQPEPAYQPPAETYTPPVQEYQAPATTYDNYGGGGGGGGYDGGGYGGE